LERLPETREGNLVLGGNDVAVFKGGCLRKKSMRKSTLLEALKDGTHPVKEKGIPLIVWGNPSMARSERKSSIR